MKNSSGNVIKQTFWQAVKCSGMTFTKVYSKW